MIDQKTVKMYNFEMNPMVVLNFLTDDFDEKIPSPRAGKPSIRKLKSRGLHKISILT